MGIEELTEALIACEGQILTRELALKILNYSATPVSDQTYLADIGFMKKEYHGYEIKPAKICEHLQDVKDLHRKQWEEIEENRPPLMADYGRFLSAEQNNGFVQIGVFKDNKIVGGCGFFVYPHIHTQLMVAEESALYLLPEHRKGLLAVVLMKYCKDFLQKVGVSEVIATVKAYADTGTMLVRLGFRKTDTVYILKMGE